MKHAVNVENYMALSQINLLLETYKCITLENVRYLVVWFNFRYTVLDMV